MSINLKTVVIYFILFFAGFQGIVFFFADLGPQETELSRLTIVFVYYFITALLVHWLSDFHGEKAFLLLWGVGLVSFLNIPELLTMASIQAAMNNLFMVFVPLVAIYLAGKSMALFGKKKKPATKKRKRVSKKKR